MQNERNPIGSNGFPTPLDDSRTGKPVKPQSSRRTGGRAGGIFFKFPVMKPSNPSLELSAHEKLYITAQ